MEIDNLAIDSLVSGKAGKWMAAVGYLTPGVALVYHRAPGTGVLDRHW